MVFMVVLILGIVLRFIEIGRGIFGRPLGPASGTLGAVAPIVADRVTDFDRVTAGADTGKLADDFAVISELVVVFHVWILFGVLLIEKSVLPQRAEGVLTA
jgi:hypothetical protein